MASNIVSESIKKAQHTVMGSADKKSAQLSESVKQPTEKSRITSDFGVKQNNTDDWLRVNSEDQIGPMLLEDNFAREKVRNHSIDIQTLIVPCICKNKRSRLRL